MTSNRSKYDGRAITAQEKRVEDGYAYGLSSLILIPNGGGRGEWLVQTGDKHVIVESRTITTNGNELTYQAFVNPTVSDNGTPVAISPFNTVQSTPSSIKVFSEPTITNDGIALPSSYIPGSSGQGNSTVGQLYTNGFMNILPPNSLIMATLTNNGSENPASCELYVVWSEVDDPAPFQS